MSKVILLGGKKRTGKNTAEKFLKNYLETKGFSVATVSFAEPLKEMVAMIFDITLEDVEFYKNNPNKTWIELINSHNQVVAQTDFRRVLQKFGTEVRNAYLGRNFWVNLAKDKVTASRADYVIISDWRFIHEASEMMKDFDTKTIIINKDTGSVDTHASEKELETFIPDYQISNEGTLEQLEEKMFKIARNLINA